MVVIRKSLAITILMQFKFKFCLNFECGFQTEGALLPCFLSLSPAGTVLW